jgi:hypothetical protein
MRLSVSPASGSLSHITNALHVCVVAAALAGVLAIPSRASAQAVTGTLLGNVTDASGAAVPGATVTATEMETNIARTTVTNETGNYIFSSLKNGRYNVEAELQGFRKIVRQNVKVDVNTTMRVDLTLEMGAVTESVTVAAETPVLQTDRTDTGRIIESKMVSEIPLGFNRNFQGILVTVPGVTRPNRPHSQFFNSQDALGMEVNGQPRLANNTLIEGLDNNHKTGLLAVIIPAADALETVSVSTSNYDAEFGRSGGAVTNVTLKSGTNDYRGSVFFFGNTESTNASDYFTHLKAPTKFAQGGFTLGGPIVRNKFFFFGDYQRTIDNLGYVVRATIPTMAMRNGDFSAVPNAIYDPLTGAVNGTGRTAFANNQIPQGRISPIARQLLAFIPEPNIAGAPLGQNNYQKAQTREKTTDAFDTKINYTLKATASPPAPTSAFPAQTSMSSRAGYRGFGLAVIPISCSGSRRACRGIGPRKPGTSRRRSPSWCGITRSSSGVSGVTTATCCCRRRTPGGPGATSTSRRLARETRANRPR